MHLCNINHYPLEVLEMAGLNDTFSIHPGKEEDITHVTRKLDEMAEIDWNSMPTYTHDNIKLTVYELSRKDASLKAVGDISKPAKSMILRHRNQRFRLLLVFRILQTLFLKMNNLNELK